MKSIADVCITLQDKEFYDNQFKEIHWNKNVLFINPQLSGRHFYKYLLPYVTMYEFSAWATAVTSIDKYKPNKEYESIKIPLHSVEILWADYIVFPFGFDDLTESYKNLRKINPNVVIVYNVDFNFYELPKNHPIFKDFTDRKAIENIETNIFNSDLTFTTNSKLTDFLLEKFKELQETKFKGQESYVSIGTLPLFIDEEIVLENCDSEIPALSFEEQTQLRIGIVATNYTWDDINSYKDIFAKVKTEFGDKVKFFLIGFDGIDYFTKKSCFPDGFEFEHIKPCTIVHYYKQLRNLQLDIMFVPLKKTTFNETTENYNKFLEASLFKIPVMVADVFPYNKILYDGDNGIVLRKKEDFLDKVRLFLQNRGELKRIGENAYKVINDNFSINERNIEIIDNIYSVEYEANDEKEN